MLSETWESERTCLGNRSMTLDRGTTDAPQPSHSFTDKDTASLTGVREAGMDNRLGSVAWSGVFPHPERATAAKIQVWWEPNVPSPFRATLHISIQKAHAGGLNKQQFGVCSLERYLFPHPPVSSHVSSSSDASAEAAALLNLPMSASL